METNFFEMDRFVAVYMWCILTDMRLYFTGLNGSHSPLSSINGRTPSPPSMTNSSMCQQLPPACGARQLSKLKRFLTTLQQFGSDISPEIGERVRMLVLGLVVRWLQIEISSFIKFTWTATLSLFLACWPILSLGFWPDFVYLDLQVMLVLTWSYIYVYVWELVLSCCSDCFVESGHGLH